MNQPITRLIIILAVSSILCACSFDLGEITEPLADAEAIPVIVLHSPPQSAYDTLAILDQTDLPQRDLLVLAPRLRKVENIPSVVGGGPFEYQVGQAKQFWVSNVDTDEHFEITALLQYITPHLYVWVEKDAEVDIEALQGSADRFETQTYPTNRRYFGTEWSPGVDNDVHLNLLLATGLGSSVAGYYSSADQFSQLAHPYSNQREMFYANLDKITVGSEFFDGLLAHEFQHMIHWYQDRNEDLWLSEGLSELAAHLNDYDPGAFETQFLERPDLQLNDFTYADEDSLAHYGAAYMFTLYFLERFGQDATRALVANPANGSAGINAVLNDLGESLDFDALFADWAAALYLDDPDLPAGPLGFRSISPGRPRLAADYSEYPVAYTETSVHQYASDYIRFSGTSPVTVIFTGTRQVPLVSPDPHEGSFFWWSNRGDDADTTLTRAFDFSKVAAVTLDYWVWYEIEKDWDYAYLEVSIDGGRNWDTIQTPHTTDENPTGNSFGHGYTGVSGGETEPQWIHEQVDLSAYAGQPALIRFEYITDGAIHETGLVLDALSIAELGFEDGFEEQDGSWEAAGFVRHDNVLPQKFVVQLLELGSQPQIRRLPLNEQGRARWNIPLSEEMPEAVLIVSGLTPVTLKVASYAYQVFPGQ